jgi:hypothetical protein
MKMKICTSLTLVISLVLLLSARAESAAKPRKLTLNEVRQLARTALTERARRLPGLDLEDHKSPNFPDFYFLIVTWGPPRSEQGGTVEQLAVDATTGDVWSGVVCREMRSPALLKLQKSIRNRIGLTERNYRRLRKKGPMC